MLSPGAPCVSCGEVTLAYHRDMKTWERSALCPECHLLLHQNPERADLILAKTPKELA